MTDYPRINIDDLKARLLAAARELLPRWLPAGRFYGHEFKVGNVRGDAGDSLSVSLTKGLWKDFSSDEGGDLIDLYAVVHGLDNATALKQLAEQFAGAPPPPPRPKPPARRVIIPVPPSAPNCNFRHSRFGDPTATWAYRDGQGRLLGHVARYDTPDGKEIVPYTFADGRGWGAGQWAEPRPLYGLERLASRPQAQVLVVEGEKCADAADKLAPFYVSVTWPGGGQAWSKCGWQALRGRRVLLWPDADVPGWRTMAGWTDENGPREGLAQHLARIGAAEIKIIDTEGQPDGWDVADALADGWDFDRLVAWAKPRARLLHRASDPGAQLVPPATAQPPADVPRETSPQRSTSKVTHIGAARNMKSPPTDGAVALQVNNLRQLWDDLGLDCQGNGRPMSNESNVLKILEGVAEFKDLLWYDSFLQRYITLRREDGTIDGARHEWLGAHITWLMIKLQAVYGLAKMNARVVEQAAAHYAKCRQRNELRAWLESLQHDGEPRVESFLTDVFGAADTAYTRAASKNFWVAMVKRVLEPGCKVDNMLVLEGAQGVGKSTALRIIGGEYFTEAHESVMSKDFYIAMQGKMLIEIGEMDAFSRAEISKVKGVITNQSDRFREPFARTAQDWPRQCILAGTTNRDDWNRDETGARRFWPVRCFEVNLSVLRETREQLFAEAVAMARGGATWWIMPADETREQQEQRRSHDDWEQHVAHWLIGRQATTSREVLTEGLGIKIEDIDDRHTKRIARCLKALNWECRVQWQAGKSVRIYRPRDAVDLDEPPIDV